MKVNPVPFWFQMASGESPGLCAEVLMGQLKSGSLALTLYVSVEVWGLRGTASDVCLAGRCLVLGHGLVHSSADWCLLSATVSAPPEALLGVTAATLQGLCGELRPLS